MIEEQLVQWQKRGFEVSLDTTVDGKWYCAISTRDWVMRDPRPHTAAPNDVQLRFVTAPQDSPRAAIEAALEVIRS